MSLVTGLMDECTGIIPVYEWVWSLECSQYMMSPVTGTLPVYDGSGHWLLWVVGMVLSRAQWSEGLGSASVGRGGNESREEFWERCQSRPRQHGVLGDKGTPCVALWSGGPGRRPQWRGEVLVTSLDHRGGDPLGPSC